MVNETSIPAGYKKTEVGVIPIDWEVKKLGECLLNRPEYGINAPAVPYSDKLPVYIRITDISDEGKFIHRNKTSVNHICSDRYILERDEIVFTRTGASTGKTYLYNPDDGILVFAGFLIRAKINTNILNPKYLKTYTETNSYWNWVRIMSMRSGQPGINGEEYSKLHVPLPSLAEQQAIAEVLSDVDALITALDRLIVKKRSIKQGAMQQLLTGQKRLPGFTGKWEMINIIDHSILKARIGWQGLTTKEYLDDGEFYLVTGTDFEGGRINWDNCCFVDENRFQQDKNIQLRENDILITKDGTIGKIAYVDKLPGKATLNSGIFVIRPKGNTYHPLFLFYLLKSEYFNLYLSQLKAGSTITHLYQKDFINFRFSAPVLLKEQEAIAQVLSDMDAELEALEKKREKYKAVKNGMMHQLLTGKTRLELRK